VCGMKENYLYLCLVPEEQPKVLSYYCGHCRSYYFKKKVSETLYMYVIGYEVSYSVGEPLERGGPIHRPSLVNTQRVDSVASNGGANRKLDIL
jgi:hypothetical protein